MTGQDQALVPTSRAGHRVDLVRGDVVTDGHRLDDAVVEVAGDRISWVGPAAMWPGPPEALPAPEPDRLVLPGLVDVHCHGAAGHGFPEAGPEGLRAAAAHHHAHGTTTLLGSLVSAPAARLLARVEALVPLVAAGELAGIHLEGPFLSPARCGAQDPRALVPGDPGLLRELLRAGGGAVASMTLAPETAHLAELLDLLAGAGVLPSFGHTDASAAVTAAAIAAAIAAVPGGRLSATHLFNGMPAMASRAPGPVGACLAAAARGEMVVELIGDGVHLADETVSVVFDLVGADQIALTTDAMAATGMPDGDYVLGPLPVDVRNGVARLAPPDDGPHPDHPRPIAGGTARLLDVLGRAVRQAGVPLTAAVTAATATPARLLGLSAEVGRIAPGMRADLLLTDHELTFEAVLRAGSRLIEPLASERSR